MSKTLCSVNNKGGVGKTHTVFHLAGAFAESGARVLVVDLDPQMNLTRLFLANSEGPTVNDVLVDQVPLTRAIRSTSVPSIDIVPADRRLGELAIELHGRGQPHTRLDTMLRERQRQPSPYDFVLLDCPPRLDHITTNALVAADGAIIPLEADQFSVDGLQQLLDLIRQLQQVNSRLVVEGILISRYHSRRAIEQAFVEKLHSYPGVRVFDVKIKDSARYRESITERKPITHYKPGTVYADAFRELARAVSRTHAITPTLAHAEA